jgi:hypothetical protein
MAYIENVMISMKNFPKRPTMCLVISLSLSFLLSGCSQIVSTSDLESVITTPLAADTVGDGLQVTISSACQITDLPIIQTNIAQGDLMTWAPDVLTLAYVAPVGRSWGWFDGDLVLYHIEDDQESFTRDIKVNGDLTWSPDGLKIAFIAFRLPENIYTVMVMDVETGEIFDLYGLTAITEEFSSQKGIIRWRDSQTIQVSERCGIDCLRVVEHNLLSGEARILEELRSIQDSSLDIFLNQPGISPNPNWFNANWSPDGGLVFFADRNNMAWVADLARETRYPLDSDIRRPLESKWSYDSRYLAVRTAERIYLYDMICP